MADSETEKEGSASQPDELREILLDDPIIDLTDPEATWEHIGRDLNPFEKLDGQQRKRLMVQILCELVAFGEFGDDNDRRPVPAAGIPVGSRNANAS